MKLIVVASGRGSNFEAIARATLDGTIPSSFIVKLVCDNPRAEVLDKAKSLGIESEVVDANQFKASGKFDRVKFEQALLEVLQKTPCDWVCLAGYMRLLGEVILNTYSNRIINIHPSLLPAFAGLNAQQQALDYGVQWTGCTVHLVNKEMDSGPILDQSVLQILPNENAQSLETRLLELEHETYIRVLQKLNCQTFSLAGRRVVWD